MAYDYELLNVFPTKLFFQYNGGNKNYKYSPTKMRLIKFQMREMIRRTVRMFEWKGLPERVPQRDLELLLQLRGYCGFLEVNGEFYALWGGLGGVPNWNYMPTQLVVANPYLKLSKTYEIYDTENTKKNVVIIPNDSLYEGLVPLLSFHTELLTEIQLTKRCVVINNRMPTAPVAPDNNSKTSVDKFFDDLLEGNLTSIQSKNIMKDVATIPISQEGRNIITQVLEMEQYQKAAMYNDIGLQLNYNMKRETITSSEAQLGEGALLPLCEDMLEQRKRACKEIKDLFGLDISVDFSSSWYNLYNTIKAELKKDESEAQKAENEAEHPEEEFKRLNENIERGGEDSASEVTESDTGIQETSD